MLGKKDRITTHNAPVLIQDMIVGAVASVDESIPTGEYNQLGIPGETVQDMHNRLNQQIETLVGFARIEHLGNNYIGNTIAPGKENSITRLVTNEFFFYTQNPLSLKEFEAITQKVMDLAKTQPQNLQLILGTFAVRVGDKVMNVAPHISCGIDPQLNLIVKNRPSDIDPTFSERQADGLYKPLDVVDRSIGDEVAAHSIQINGTNQFFTFNTVAVNQTAAGATFYTATDICLDHFYGTAKSHLTQNVNDALNVNPAHKTALPESVSHVVISNTITLKPEHCLGTVSHATPSLYTLLPSLNRDKVSFGTDFAVNFLPARVCDPLPQAEAALVHGHNQSIQPVVELSSSASTSSTSSSSATATKPVDLKLSAEEKQFLKMAKISNHLDYEKYADALYKVYTADPILADKLMSKLSREDRSNVMANLNVAMDRHHKVVPAAYGEWLNSKTDSGHSMSAMLTSRKELNDKIEQFNDRVDKVKGKPAAQQFADLKSQVQAQHTEAKTAQSDEKATENTPSTPFRPT